MSTSSPTTCTDRRSIRIEFATSVIPRSRTASVPSPSTRGAIPTTSRSAIADERTT